MNSDIAFVLIYILFVICVVHPPVEVQAAGFTIPFLFESILGNENVDFIQFHIKRTCLTLLIYSLLPLMFILGLNTFVSEDVLLIVLLKSHPNLYLCLTTLALILPILAIIQIYGYIQEWIDHPIIKALKSFTSDDTTWQTLATNINNEYRRVAKLCIKTSPITTLIATENWIIKVLPLNVFIAHQNDATLTVINSNTHVLSYENPGASQYITIEVKTNQVPSFKLRLNALDFQDLQDHVSQSINILPAVNFQKSIAERFLIAFKEVVKDNPRYEGANVNDLDICIGCMQNISNLKLQKSCVDKPGETKCSNCSCKPMWCINCLANWFVHRQDASKADTWLLAKCTCPTCRATFCLLDVCPIETTNSI